MSFKRGSVWATVGAGHDPGRKTTRFSRKMHPIKGLDMETPPPMGDG